MQSVSELINGFSRLKVLIIGDLMIDSYTWGRVSRISPEAPVPVVNVIRRESRLGGAGNVVLNIASLGATAVICSVIGDDAPGRELQKIILDANLSTEGLIVEPGRMTTVKERIIAGSQQVVRVDSETENSISLSSQQALLAHIKDSMSDVDVIIFEDYDKGVLSAKLIQSVISMAKENNIPTVVDPKRKNFFAYQGATLFKPNLHELRDGLGLMPTDFDADHLAETVRKFKVSQEFTGVFVTLSERGVYIDFENDQHLIPAHIRQISDVSGAGDTVISIAACVLALGGSTEQIASLANLGGGLVCESLGVVPIDLALLRKEADQL
ncbi:MAG: D-glycero-beta-D-manno-heptose-7-phosphate kinase [Cytophagia bacterium]|nr:D-glycero-beta-D-manno-heptose-7-phosphate kinase [Cytophagia bacterium]